MTHFILITPNMCSPLLVAISAQSGGARPQDGSMRFASGLSRPPSP